MLGVEGLNTQHAHDAHVMGVLHYMFCKEKSSNQLQPL